MYHTHTEGYQWAYDMEYVHLKGPDQKRSMFLEKIHFLGRSESGEILVLQPT